jgi:hypothetical protein
MAAEAMDSHTPVDRLKSLRREMARRAKDIEDKHEQLFKLKADYF